MKHVTNVIITLAVNDLWLREQRLSDVDGKSNGNFLETIHLLAHYDDVLSDLIKN